MSCLREEMILGFVEGRLESTEMARVEAHARECSTCDELLAGAFHDSSPGVAEAPIALGPGTRVGRYTALDLLGAGGMSQVYAAYDSKLDRKIALKLLRPHGSANLNRTRRDEGRLLREGQAIARLRHQNVIAVHDVGRFGGRVFIATEFVEGRTLSAWLREQPRSTREIVAVFVDAARGLGAAHAAGIVHRDFKPQNVMVGRDGVVRVMDFGLAARLDRAVPVVDAEIDVAPTEDAQEEDLTSTGEIVGTPAYMAPEQLNGESADARSDQFSFCVGLYQALHGEHPFLDSSERCDVRARMSEARIRRTSASGAVPPSIRRAIVRGLSGRREDRWPSMDALVTALLQAPVSRRRRVIGIISGVAALAVVMVGVPLISRHHAVAICQGGPTRLGDAWSIADPSQAGSSRRAAAAAAFQSTGLSMAAETWSRVSVLVDRYAQQWLLAYRESCEATYFRDEQSATVLNQRMACLEERHAALEELTRRFTAADAGVVVNAVDAVSVLPPLDRCSDLRRLRAAEDTSVSRDVRARADGLRRRAISAKAIYDTGNQRLAVERGETLLAEARALAYPPLTAEILLMVGRFESSAMFEPRAVTRLREATQIALRSQRDDIAAEALVTLSGLAGLVSHRPADSEIWADLADALMDRMGEGQSRLRSWVMNDRGNARLLDGDYAGALRWYHQALALKQKLLGPDDVDVLRTTVSEAEALHRMGRDDQALELCTAACRSLETAYGSQSPFVGNCLSNRGEYLLGVHRAADGLAVLEDAMARWQLGLTRDHPFLAYTLTAIGRAHLLLGRGHDALSPLERAHRIREAHEPDPALRAETEFALAQALWVTGSRAQAEVMALAAKGSYLRESIHTIEAHAIDDWLALHRSTHGRRLRAQAGAGNQRVTTAADVRSTSGSPPPRRPRSIQPTYVAAP